MHQTHTPPPAGPVPQYPIDQALAAMPSSAGPPCTEAYLFGEMACACPDDAPPFDWLAMLHELWCWLKSPSFF